MIHPVLMLVQDSFTFETITVTPEHKIQGTHFSNKNCEDNDVRKFKSSICGSYKNVRLAHLAVRQSSSLHHISFFSFIFSKSVRRDFNTTTDRDKSVFSLLLQSSVDGLGHSCLLSKMSHLLSLSGQSVTVPFSWLNPSKVRKRKSNNKTEKLSLVTADVSDIMISGYLWAAIWQNTQNISLRNRTFPHFPPRISVQLLHC